MKERQSLEAIILKRWDYGEKDLIVSFLSREKGRLQGIAKGAKSSLKRFGPALDLFAWVKLQVVERKHNSLYLIDQAQIISNVSQLRQDYASILLASGLLELSQHLFREGLHEEGAFLHLLESLQQLEKQGARRRVFWSFLIRNFEMMGWGLHLKSCEKCNKNFENEKCVFDVLQGSSLCLDCSRSSRQELLISPRLASWLNNPQGEAEFSLEEEALMQDLLEKHYQQHIHLMPDWNRFLKI